MAKKGTGKAGRKGRSAKKGKRTKVDGGEANGTEWGGARTSGKRGSKTSKRGRTEQSRRRG
jgi:hypothetical protein